jgi:hypothetical protein
MDFEGLIFDDSDHPTHLYLAGIVLAALAFLVAVRKGMAPGNVM